MIVTFEYKKNNPNDRFAINSEYRIFSNSYNFDIYITIEINQPEIDTNKSWNLKDEKDIINMVKYYQLTDEQIEIISSKYKEYISKKLTEEQKNKEILNKFKI